MRVFAISDLHLDFHENAVWLRGVSASDYVDDTLILAGDISERLEIIASSFEWLRPRFSAILYVPGNHDLWLSEEDGFATSFDKFARVQQMAAEIGVSMLTLRRGSLAIVPLLAWYDFSFGVPDATIKRRWMDFRRCRWPDGVHEAEITRRFLAENRPLEHAPDTVISFSHFVPRIDLMPPGVPPKDRTLYPVLGSTALNEQIRRLGSHIHVYGHSHINRDLVLDGTRYVNNAFGYPSEGHITAKCLRCIHEC